MVNGLQTMNAKGVLSCIEGSTPRALVCNSLIYIVFVLICFLSIPSLLDAAHCILTVYDIKLSLMC